MAANTSSCNTALDFSPFTEDNDDGDLDDDLVIKEEVRRLLEEPGNILSVSVSSSSDGSGIPNRTGAKCNETAAAAAAVIHDDDDRADEACQENDDRVDDDDHNDDDDDESWPAPLDEAKFVKFYKTKPCPWYPYGRCRMGDRCNWAHSAKELRPSVDLTKTKLCEMLLRRGQCSIPHCRFAHTRDELRATTDVYKTSLCLFWLKRKGSCNVGTRCRYAHGLEELREKAAPSSSSSSSTTTTATDIAQGLPFTPAVTTTTITGRGGGGGSTVCFDTNSTQCSSTENVDTNLNNISFITTTGPTPTGTGAGVSTTSTDCYEPRLLYPVCTVPTQHVPMVVGLDPVIVSSASSAAGNTAPEYTEHLEKLVRQHEETLRMQGECIRRHAEALDALQCLMRLSNGTSTNSAYEDLGNFKNNNTNNRTH